MSKKDIAVSIAQRINGEYNQRPKYPAVARVDTTLDGRRKLFWLVNGTHNDTRPPTDITGQRQPGLGGRPGTLQEGPGSPIAKNSELGGALIMGVSGPWTNIRGEQMDLRVLTHAQYRPDVDMRDALDCRISMEGQPHLHIPSVKGWLRALPEPNTPAQTPETEEHEEPETTTVQGPAQAPQPEAEQEDNEEWDEAEWQALLAQEEEENARREAEQRRVQEKLEAAREAEKQLQKEAEALQQKQDLEAYRAKRKEQREAEERRAELEAEHRRQRRQFVLTSQGLRSQHILDPTQEQVKRSRNFNGEHLIIEGGPGTGKTTTMIQRLMFLTDPTVEQHEHLTPQQKNLLNNPNTSWSFFSPNALLKEYLEQAMTAEGLSHVSHNVQDWNRHLSSWAQQALYKTKNFAPLDDDTARKKGLFFSQAGKVRSLHRIIESTHIDIIQNATAKAAAFASNDEVVDRTVGHFVAALVKDTTNVSDYFTAFNNLGKTRIEQDGAESKTLKTVADELLRQGRESRDMCLDTLTFHWQTDESLKAELLEIRQAKSNVTLRNPEQALEDTVRDAIRTWSEIQCKVTPPDALDETERNIIEKLEPHWSATIGQHAAQIAYSTAIHSLVDGLKVNVFTTALTAFRAARRTEAYEAETRDRNPMVIDDKGASRLHPEEEALFFSYANRLMATYRRILRSDFDATTPTDMHPFQSLWMDRWRPVIAVDEACDLSLIHHDAIHSLLHPDLNSITFCGDPMQRTTTTGLRKWDELQSLIDRRISTTGSYLHLKALETSYRQSKPILDVAAAIYRERQSKDAPYTAYNSEDAHAPRPKYLLGQNSDEQIDYIAHYILEIHDDYDDINTPTIAVIVAEEKLVKPAATALQEHTSVSERGLSIIACTNGQVLGHDSQVRVFSAEHIKGLEFEAVIFMGVDQIKKNYSADYMYGSMYVGISRAAYHLLITESTNEPSLGNYISDFFEVI